MKKIFLSTILLFSATSLVFGAQPPKKASMPVAVDSTSAILEKAKAGDANAQNTVGVWYYTGKDSIKQDYAQALQWWAKSAKQENTDAIANMAMCYQLGRGTEKDSALAVSLYEAAIKKGNKNVIPQHETIVKNTKSVFSSLLLRDCYIKGIGVKRDLVKSLDYQKIAAEGGHLDSQFSLALHFLNNKQSDESVKWFKKAAKQGHAGATYYYGYQLFNGMGIDQDKKAGISCFTKASKLGFPMADYQLGLINRDGNGVDKDVNKAFNFMKSAACHGNTNAKWELGKMYLKGEGTAVDYYFATQWFAEVAAKSHKKEMNELLKEDNEGTYSQYLMGLREYYVDKDYSDAYDYFKKVEKAKNPEGATMMGLCLANEKYEKQNLKKAVKTLTKASENSNIATYYLASLYESGTGVDKDEKKAIELMTKAADAGIAKALCNLGDRYMAGDGVAKDMTKAAQLYLEAESQGYLTPKSAKNLAQCYQKKLNALSDLKNADKRIEKLNKQKANGNLISLLKVLEDSK